MSEKKMTKKDYFNQIKAKYDLTEKEIAFIDHEIELLDKKNAKSKNGEKSLTPKQKANAELAQVIYDGMEDNKQYTIGALIKALGLKDEEGCPLSTSKVSAVIRTNLLNVKVERTVIKGTAYFSKIAEEVEGE